MIKRLQQHLTDYFHYSPAEKRGFWVLLGLCGLVYGATEMLFLWQRSTPSINEAEYDKISTFFQNVTAKNDSLSYKQNYVLEDKPNERNSEKATFTFNPNTATGEELQRLGLGASTIKGILNYRTKGGIFRQKSDFAKIYTLSKNDFERLEPFLLLPTEFNVVKEAKILDKPFPFDPNTASENELLALKLPPTTVKILLNFREKGGIFKNNEDFKKIYSLRETDYERLKNFIQINDIQRDSKNLTIVNNQKYVTEKRDKPIDVNTAKLEDWLQVRGIGRIFAVRILHYRTELGGFVSLEQLKEVQGMTDSTLKVALPFLRIAPSTSPTRISINSLVANDSLRHPYLNRKQAQTLNRYRINHGNFRSIDDLRKSKALLDTTLQKLQPYLIYD